jgi:hypothetical protein
VGIYDLRGFSSNQSFSKAVTFIVFNWKNQERYRSYYLWSLRWFDYGRVWLDGETSNKWHQSMGGGIWQ